MKLQCVINAECGSQGPARSVRAPPPRALQLLSSEHTTESPLPPAGLCEHTRMPQAGSSLSSAFLKVCVSEFTVTSASLVPRACELLEAQAILTHVWSPAPPRMSSTRCLIIFIDKHPSTQTLGQPLALLTGLPAPRPSLASHQPHSQSPARAQHLLFGGFLLH